MQKSLHPCYILHRRDYRNNSLLLELFCRELGRLPAIARGVKSARSAKQGYLQPFQPLQLGLAGRGEIRSVTTVDSDMRGYPLTGNRLYCGLYLNELLMRMTARNDPHLELYDRYTETLRRLSQEATADHALRQFEIGMLHDLGYGLLLDCEAETGCPLQPDQLYRYRIEQGPIRDETTKQSGVVVHGSTLLALHGGDAMSEKCANEAKGLMRFILSHYLGDKPLKSRELFRPVQS